MTIVQVKERWLKEEFEVPRTPTWGNYPHHERNNGSHVADGVDYRAHRQVHPRR